MFLYFSVSGSVLRASTESPVQWCSGLCSQEKNNRKRKLIGHLVQIFGMNRVLVLFLLMSLRLGVEAHEHLYLYLPSLLYSLVHFFALWDREIFLPGVMQPQLEASVLTSSFLTVHSACNITHVFRYVLTYQCFCTPTSSGLLCYCVVFLLH